MRPTNCNFLSPKLKTGEYVYPSVNAYGNVIGFGRFSSKRLAQQTFGQEQRFLKSRRVEREAERSPGPGSYSLIQPYESIQAFIDSSHHAVSFHFDVLSRIVRYSTARLSLPQANHIPLLRWRPRGHSRLHLCFASTQKVTNRFSTLKQRADPLLTVSI